MSDRNKIVPSFVGEDGRDAIATVRRRILGLIEKSLDVAERALDGEKVERSQLEAMRTIIQFSPKVEKDQGMPVHLHLSVPRPKKLNQAQCVEMDKARMIEGQVVDDEDDDSDSE